MANTISNITIANTFGDWVSTTVQTVNELNFIGNNDWHKAAGTLYLDSAGVGLDVTNDAYFRKQLIVTGLGSGLTVYKNADVRGVLYLTNLDTDANPNKLIFSANGVANVNYINVTGSGLAANVSNSMFIGGVLSVTGNTNISSNVNVTGDAFANNGILTNNLTVGKNAEVVNNLTVDNNTFLADDVFATKNVLVTLAVRADDLAANDSVTGINMTASGKIVGANVVSNTFVFAPQSYSYVQSTSGHITSNTNAVIIGTAFADYVQANTAANTRTLSVTGTASADYVQANTAANTRTLSVTGTTSTDYLQANTAANTRTLSVTGTTSTNSLQANTAANTRTLSVTGTASVDYLQANTAANTRTLSVTGVTFTDVLQANSSASVVGTTSTDSLQANTAANTRTLSVTGTASVDYLQANTAANTRTLSVTGTASADILVANTLFQAPSINVATITTRTLQANLSVNTTYANAVSISVNGTANVNLLNSNTEIIAGTNVVANSGTVWSSLISAPDLRFTNSLLGDGGTSGSTTVTAGAGNFGTVTVTGNFVISGATVYNSNEFTLNSAAVSNVDGSFANYRPLGSNAQIRWTESTKTWDIRDVDNPTRYNRILTANDYSSINTATFSAISANVATLNNNISSNVSTLNSTITTANTNLKNYVDESNTKNILYTNAQISANVSTLNSTISTANTNLKNYVDNALTSYAPLASPTLTGIPLSTTAANGTFSTQIATTAFVNNANNILRTYSDAVFATKVSPTLTGAPLSVTAAAGTSNTMIATTAFVATANSNMKTYVDGTFLSSATASSTYAPLASPTLTGAPLSVTAANGTSNTMIATTAFVATANGFMKTYVDGTFAPLASPTLVGVPLSVTAANGTSNTMIATTAFVATANGFMKTYVDGTFLTTSTASSTYAPLASPTLSGYPQSPTAPNNIANNWIATTSFVATANSSMKTYVDNTFLTTTSASSTYAPLLSPTLTGAPLSVTAAAGTSNTMIATTAFVQTANSNMKTYVDGNFLTTSSASSTYAPLVSPTLTGSPVAPTAAVGTSNTMIATTAFVQAANSNMKTYTDGTFVRLSSASQTITGDVTVTGSLVINGTTTTVNTSVIQTTDSLIKLAQGQTSTDVLDIGFYGSYQTGGFTRYTGLFRKAADKYYLSQGITTDPTSNNVSEFGSLYRATLDADYTGDFTSGRIITFNGTKLVSLANTGTAGTYGSANVVPVITTDALGRVSGVSSTSISITPLQINSRTGTGPAVLAESPILQITPTSPTAATGTSNTMIATTAFVQTANSNMKVYVDGRFLPTTTAASTYAPLASPALTGTPTAPTAAGGTSTTQIATTAYVQATGYNSQGAKTVQSTSSGVPSNATGNNGDIIYQY